MRLWYQFNFYNLHFSADYGYVTVGANIVRVIVLGVLIFITYRAGFSRVSKSFFAWSSLILMTASSFFYFFDLFFGSTSFEVIRFIVGGIGLVGGEVIWIFFLERLKPGEAFLYAAGGLALSCFLSLIAGYFTPEAIGIINLFIPALAVFAYWRAMDVLDKRNYPSLETQDSLYADSLNKQVKHTIIAFFLYALLLGMALGYPDGRLRELSQGVRSLHQILVVALVFFTVWWVLVRGRGFKLSTFWYFENILMILSITLLMAGWSSSEEWSTFFVTNAITCFYIPLVFFIYLIGRHSKRPAAVLYGIIYGGALLAMSAGRIIVYLVSPFLEHSLWLLICMAFVVLIEMVLILRPNFMGDYPIGFELKALLVKKDTLSSVELSVENDLTEFGKSFDLTNIELEIVRLISQGRSRHVISTTLNYSENTIRNYTRTIYQKVGVHTKQELLDVLGLY